MSPLEVRLPGIFFACLGNRGSRAADLQSSLKRERCVDERFTLERLTNGIWNPDQPAQRGRYVVFVDGEIGRRDALWRHFRSAASPCPATDHQLIAALLESGVSLEECVRHCEGGFFLAVFDRTEGSVRFANDRFGLRPHFYARKGAALVLGPTLKSCLAAPWVERRFDSLSVAEYFCFQCVMEERTLLQDVLVFPAGSLGRFDLAAGEFAVRPYWNWSELVAPRYSGSFDTAVEEAAALFKAACRDEGQSTQRLGIYLSGGLDSRLILAARGGGPGLHTFCFGPPDSPDIVYARRCAKAASTTHHEFTMHDGQWIRQIARQHAELVEGGHGLSHAHNLWRADEAARHIDVNLSGHFGDLLLGGSYVFAGPRPQLRDSLYKVFMEKWGGGFASAGDYVAASAGSPNDLPDRMSAAFDASLAPFSDLPPGMAHDLFALQFHGRKQIQYYLVHNRPWFESRTPFLDLPLLRLLYSLPAEFRADRRLQSAVLKRYSARLAAIPWAGTRLPPVNRGVARLRTQVEERFGRALRLLTGSRLAAPTGKLLNHCYGDWFGEDLKDWVSRTLSPDTSHVSRLFEAGFIRNAVDSARGRRQAGLLGLLLSLECVMPDLGVEA